MKRTKPPFRADHVGSFLRPAALKEARAKREKGEITAAQLKEVEDREIEKIIRKQEEIGLKLATDGEFRRSWWHFDFFGMLDGVEIFELDHGIQFQGVQTKAQSLRINGKIGFSNHPMLEHFKFLKAHTKVMPKMTIPAPTVLHFRLAKDGIDKDVYPDIDGFFDDLGAGLPAGGEGVLRRRLPLSAVRRHRLGLSVLAGGTEARRASAMSNVDQLQDIYARIINEALEGKPADMTITTHVCRGNFRSTWISEGGYEPVAENLLGKRQLRRLLPRIRHRARRRLRAAALPAQGQQDRGARPRHLQERHAGEEGRRQAPHRRGGQVRAARPVLPVAAMRLRLDRGRQRAGRGGAMGEAAHDRRIATRCGARATRVCGHK